jgi:hypothetical protein
MAALIPDGLPTDVTTVAALIDALPRRSAAIDDVDRAVAAAVAVRP